MGQRLVQTIPTGSRLKYLLKLQLVLLMFPLIGSAAENPADSSATSSSAVSHLWWRCSSMKTAPLPDRLFFHSEATLSYEWKTGNLDGDEQNCDAMTALRWKRLTNYLLFEVENKTYKVIPSNQSFHQRRYALEGIIRFDLNRDFFVDGDVLYNKDTSILLSQRLAWYGGLGVYLQKSTADISFFLGFGHDSKNYNSVISFADSKGEALFFTETIDYALGPKTELRQLFRFIKPIESAGLSEYDIKATLTHTVTTSIALVFMFEYIYNKVAIPNVLSHNTDQGIGLRLMF